MIGLKLDVSVYGDQLETQNSMRDGQLSLYSLAVTKSFLCDVDLWCESVHATASRACLLRSLIKLLSSSSLGIHTMMVRWIF